jgi:hypothetical protein
MPATANTDHTTTTGDKGNTPATANTTITPA